jgi:putative FmdB family regulatory protein
MPKYSYKCGCCEYQFTTHHGIREDPSGCPECNSTGDLTKMVNEVYVKKTHAHYDSAPGRVGDVTKQAIEDNKEILEDAKAEERNLSYDDFTNNPR